MATKKSSAPAENAALKEKRELQLQQISEKREELAEFVDKARQMKKEFLLLSSVLDGLYEEIDKLCKKAPAEQVTELVLVQVNDIIRAIKDLAKDDPYVQKQNEFIAAGDNPEQRDVVVVLKQLRQGLDRFKGTIDPRIELFNGKLNEAASIQIALELFMEGKREIEPSDITNQGYSPSSLWFFKTDEYGRDKAFNWAGLDRIDIEKYFPSW